VDELPELGTLARLDERLREVATDEAAVEAALGQARAALAREPNAAARARLLSYCGTALRLLGRHEEAVAAQREALSLSGRGSRARTVTRIRLAEAQRCAGALGEAEREALEALAEARDQHPELVDFSLQHLGKALLDAGEPERAAAALEEALALREAKGDEALVRSTRLALDRARG